MIGGLILGDLELQVFSDRLRELRLSMGLTQSQFVENIGITPAALSAYENNTKNPSISVAKRIAEKYNVSIDWLCGLSEEKNIDNEMFLYSDIIRALIKIEQKIKMTCDSSRILIYNKKLGKFLGDWRGMINLHSNGTIDDNLYSLWVTQQLKNYDVKILSKDGLIELEEDGNQNPDTTTT